MISAKELKIPGQTCRCMSGMKQRQATAIIKNYCKLYPKLNEDKLYCGSKQRY